MAKEEMFLQAQEDYYREIETHPTMGWRCGLMSFPKYITKSRTNAAWIFWCIDNYGYDPPHFESYTSQWKYWAKEANELRLEEIRNRRMKNGNA